MSAQTDAIRYLLDRIQGDADLHWVLGWGTEGFRRLCLAEAEATGRSVAEVEAERKATFFKPRRRVRVRR